MMQRAMVAAAALLGWSSTAWADTTPQALPFSQDWANDALITIDDDWSTVPGIIGYRGDGMTSGVNALAVVADGSTTPVDVNANQTSATFSTAGVTEFQTIAPAPVVSAVSLAGSGTADSPHLVIAVDTTGAPTVVVQFDVIDLENGADNAIQPVALQYRVGASGNFANVTGGHVADATQGPNVGGLVTRVAAVLPSDAGNQPVIHIRVLTINAAGNDEWIAIDNITVTSATMPDGSGAATPATQNAGGSIQLSATVVPGTNPTSTLVGVTCNLTTIGGGAAVAMFDDGAHLDGAAGDNVFGLATTIAANTTAGAKPLPCTASDAQSRTDAFAIDVTVTPVCGDGRVEGSEICDDDDLDDGDGCSSTCTLEGPGWSCVGTAPTVCTDFDECAGEGGGNDCHANAGCTDSDGSYSCACDLGYSGDGRTTGSGCTDFDECIGENGGNLCHANADCSNTGGSYTCACDPGYDGNGFLCTDFNECLGENGGNVCHGNADCSNTGGSYSCACDPGYGGDGRTTGTGCTDFDECAGENGGNVCHGNADCSNTGGSYSCACDPGYGGDGRTTGTGCTDFDECAGEGGGNVCHGNADCTDSDGSYSCACDPGYGGDGRTTGTGCSDVDECADDDDNDCDLTHGACVNLGGGFACDCDAGFTGDGHTGGAGTGCTDIDECTANTDDCSTFAACTDNDGSFMCMCNTGYSGNGVTCTAICGDGLVVTPEGCDDDETADADGCTATCTVETGWDCTGAPSDCTAICGDGLVLGDEGCDDDNGDDGDGCDVACATEEGFVCTGAPSTCSPISLCGDGVIDAGEACDDGNDASDDGCDDSCAIEPGFGCEGEPSVCVLDGDGDGVTDDADNCPTVANPSQADADGDDLGNACDADEPDPEQAGCCSTNDDPGSPGGLLLLALVSAAGLRRRRRSVKPARE